MQFQRGPYGEILLAPLMAEPPTEAALQMMVGEEQYKKMTLAKREALYEEMVHTIHRQNLQRALSGEMTDEPKAVDLYRAVMRGEPLNLYPLGLKKKAFTSFVPILRRTGDEQWQFGHPEKGCYALMAGAVGPVLQQVWQLYEAWLEIETNKEEGEGTI